LCLLEEGGEEKYSLLLNILKKSLEREGGGANPLKWGEEGDFPSLSRELLFRRIDLTSILHGGGWEASLYLYGGGGPLHSLRVGHFFTNREREKERVFLFGDAISLQDKGPLK